jgi:glutathione S-transferase
MSPYSRKMVALLRYRHIPYQIIWGDINQKLTEFSIEKPKPVLYPVFLMPDENGREIATVDSTPIIRTLEGMYEGRSVLPDNPALAFINYLLEDFGDEWLTKYMFHYRWTNERDIDEAKSKLVYSSVVTAPSDFAKEFAETFGERQIGRLFWVGSNDMTAPLIEASYKRFLALMDKHIETQPFLLGARPCSADFAVFGQLTQLIAVDSTPREIAHNISKRTVSWVDIMEDQSGLDPDMSGWNDPDNLPDTMIDILREVGRTYVPTMIANAKAAKAGEKEWSCELDRATWQQPVNAYQAKALGWVRNEFEKLDTANRNHVRSILDNTGCEALVEDIQ